MNADASKHRLHLYSYQDTNQTIVHKQSGSDSQNKVAIEGITLVDWPERGEHEREPSAIEERKCRNQDDHKPLTQELAGTGKSLLTLEIIPQAIQLKLIGSSYSLLQNAKGNKRSRNGLEGAKSNIVSSKFKTHQSSQKDTERGETKNTLSVIQQNVEKFVKQNKISSNILTQNKVLISRGNIKFQQNQSHKKTEESKFQSHKPPKMEITIEGREALQEAEVQQFKTEALSKTLTVKNLNTGKIFIINNPPQQTLTIDSQHVGSDAKGLGKFGKKKKSLDGKPNTSSSNKFIKGNQKSSVGINQKRAQSTLRQTKSKLQNFMEKQSSKMLIVDDKQYETNRSLSRGASQQYLNSGNKSFKTYNDELKQKKVIKRKSFLETQPGLKFVSKGKVNANVKKMMKQESGPLVQVATNLSPQKLQKSQSRPHLQPSGKLTNDIQSFFQTQSVKELITQTKRAIEKKHVQLLKNEQRALSNPKKRPSEEECNDDTIEPINIVLQNQLYHTSPVQDSQSPDWKDEELQEKYFEYMEGIDILNTNQSDFTQVPVSSPMPKGTVSKELMETIMHTDPSFSYSPSCYDMSGGISRFYKDLYKKQLAERMGSEGEGDRNGEAFLSQINEEEAKLCAIPQERESNLVVKKVEPQSDYMSRGVSIQRSGNGGDLLHSFLTNNSMAIMQSSASVKKEVPPVPQECFGGYNQAMIDFHKNNGYQNQVSSFQGQHLNLLQQKSLPSHGSDVATLTESQQSQPNLLTPNGLLAKSSLLASQNDLVKSGEELLGSGNSQHCLNMNGGNNTSSSYLMRKKKLLDEQVASSEEFLKESQMLPLQGRPTLTTAFTSSQVNDTEINSLNQQMMKINQQTWLKRSHQTTMQHLINSPTQQEEYKDSFSEQLPSSQQERARMGKGKQGIFEELEGKQAQRQVHRKARMPRVIIDEEKEDEY